MHPLTVLTLLPADIDQPDGTTFGMKKAMLLMALVAIVLLVACAVIGKALARRRPQEPPVYPILDRSRRHDVGPRG